MDTRGAKSLLEDVGLYLEGQEDRINELESEKSKLETKIDQLEEENLYQKGEIKFIQAQISDYEAQSENRAQRGE